MKVSSLSTLAVAVVAMAACGRIDALGVDGGHDARTDAGKAGAGGGGTAGGSGAGTGGVGGQAGAGGASGAGGGGPCTLACTTGRACCGNACVNLQNDPMNCGACGKRCAGSTSLCDGGNCVQPPCNSTAPCPSGGACCGSSCCAPGDLCCAPQGPVAGGPPSCFTPTADQKTCPQGCAPLCVSDRDRKKDIGPVDTADILAKVSRLPISTWTYIEEPAGVRHVGPMAQDFHASFGLGSDDRTYNSIDAHGVALAAIQALEHRLAEQQRRIDKLERDNRELARRLRGAR